MIMYSVEISMQICDVVIEKSILKHFVLGIDSKAIHYFIPSLVALGRGIYISLMIRFLYYNCLGFDLVLWLQHNIIPNTV